MVWWWVRGWVFEMIGLNYGLKVCCPDIDYRRVVGWVVAILVYDKFYFSRRGYCPSNIWWCLGG